MTIPEPRETEADVRAVAATMDGAASPDQQRHAIGWILQELCRVEGLPPEDAIGLPHHAHHEGRRYVGLRILRMRLPSTLEAAQRRAAEDIRRKATATTRRGAKP